MLEILEIVVSIIISIFFLTQIIIPGFSSNMKFFWAFRKSKLKEVAEELVNIEEERIVQELKTLASQQRKTLEKTKETRQHES